jgi:hemerythrin-like domain-containing protein
MEAKMGETITQIMLKDHCMINRLFEDIRYGIEQQSSLVPKMLEDFKWGLQRHFFIEEKAIFTNFEPKDEEMSKAVNDVVEEHSMILDELKKVEDMISHKRDVDVSKLQESLEKHRELEDETIYPMLDEYLDCKKIDEIVDRVKNEWDDEKKSK